MQAIKFIKKQLNFSKKWIISVVYQNETLSSEALTARLMYKHGYRRKEINELTDKIKCEILEELLNGNTVDVFGIVKIKAEYSLKKRFSGEEHEVTEMASRLSFQDIKIRLKANINQTFNHKYIKMFAPNK